MITVKHDPRNLFRSGAEFAIKDWASSVALGAFPKGMVFEDADGRTIEVIETGLVRRDDDMYSRPRLDAAPYWAENGDRLRRKNR